MYGVFLAVLGVMFVLSSLFIMYNWKTNKFISVLCTFALLATFAVSQLSITGYLSSGRSGVVKTEKIEGERLDTGRVALKEDMQRRRDVRQELKKLSSLKDKRGYLRSSEREQRAYLQKLESELNKSIEERERGIGFSLVEVINNNSVFFTDRGFFPLNRVECGKIEPLYNFVF